MSDGWIEHDGKGMPVDCETLVHVMFRDGLQSHRVLEARTWMWEWPEDDINGADLVAYRLAEAPEDGK